MARRRARGGPVVIGLTGSIGMGKSTAARTLERMGIPVHDADAAVHRLIGPGGRAVAAVGAAFPGVVRDGAVDRAALGKRVFNDKAALARLEAVLHPMVRRQAHDFLRRMARRREPVAVLDIPLLFETGGEALCDATIVVSAPRRVQEARVLNRPGMTRARLEAIRASQMPDAEKRRHADYVVNTGLGKRDTLRRLRAAIQDAVARTRRSPNRRGRHA